MARPGKVHHWKHGWIPIDEYAQAIKQGYSKDEARDVSLGARFPVPGHKRKSSGPPLTGDQEKDRQLKSGFALIAAAGGGGGGADDPANMRGGGLIPPDFLIGTAQVFYRGYPEFPGQSREDFKAVHRSHYHETVDPDRAGYLTQGEHRIHRRDDVGDIDTPVVLSQSTKMQPDLLKKIQTDGGFTYNPRTNGLIEPGKAAGFVVAVPGTEMVVGEEDPSKNEYVDREEFAQAYAALVTKHKSLLDNGAVIGGWYSPQRNQFMLEVSQILPAHDRNRAVEVGKSRNQEEIFDLATGESISTGGTGDAPLTAKAAPQVSFAMATRPMTQHSTALTPDEVAAAKYYTGPGFRPLNAALRNDTVMSLPVKARMDRLDALLAKSVTTEDLTVYRGVQSGAWLPENLAPGTLIPDKGYVSTAGKMTSIYGGDTQMVIKVPAGTHAVDLNGHSLTHHAQESELLLGRGTTMRVVSDVRTGNSRLIQAEVVKQ